MGDKSYKPLDIDDPISIEKPIQRPSTKPEVVEVLKNAEFDHAHPPVKNEVTLPEGNWDKVILTITGTQQGRQYDRIMHIWADHTQIFAGCTPEPTQKGIEWKVEKDITIYQPILKGGVTFTTQLENYMDELHTGIPNMSFSLEFYAAEEEKVDRKEWELPIPDSIVPILSEAKPYSIEKDQVMDANVTLPSDMKELYLDLYVIHQNRDEFYWSLNRSFRGVEIYIDDQPAGVVWPDPILYTGGVNPLLYRPINGLCSADIPTFTINLTPFAGLLGGDHKISIRVENNENYWLIGGSLFLYQNNGQETKGRITKNTLEFPTQSELVETDVLDYDPEKDKLRKEHATLDYTIQGEVETDEGTYTSTVESSLKFSSNKSDIYSKSWSITHGAQVVITDEHLTKDGETVKKQHSESTHTLDCSSSYLRDKEEKGISMNSSLAQIFSDEFKYESENMSTPYESSLYLNSQAYAVYQRVNQIPNATNMNSTAHVHFHDSENDNYKQTLMTRDGQVYYDNEQK